MYSDIARISIDLGTRSLEQVERDARAWCESTGTPWPANPRGRLAANIRHEATVTFHYRGRPSRTGPYDRMVSPSRCPDGVHRRIIEVFILAVKRRYPELAEAAQNR